MPTLLNWDSQARNVNQVALTLKPRKKRHSSGMNSRGAPSLLRRQDKGLRFRTSPNGTSGAMSIFKLAHQPTGILVAERWIIERCFTTRSRAALEGNNLPLSNEEISA